MTKWKKEQLQLENAYVQAMLHEDGIVETTTKRQWKNGTRQFKLPTGQLLATYKSGYVRRCDSSDRIWQLNHKYKRTLVKNIRTQKIEHDTNFMKLHKYNIYIS